MIWAAICRSTVLCTAFLLSWAVVDVYGQCDQVPTFYSGPVKLDSTLLDSLAIPPAEIYASYGFEMSFLYAVSYFRC